MTTLTDRPLTALLVIDVQTGVVAEALDRDAVVARIVDLVDRARVEQAPVVWVQHSDDDLPLGSPQWQLAPEMLPAEGEAVVRKQFGDSFEDTDLEQTLAELGVGSLVVCGAESDACVRSTLHGALARGYDTLLVSDAHTTSDLTQWGNIAPEDVVRHTNLYWSFTRAPGRTAGTVRTDEVAFT